MKLLKLKLNSKRSIGFLATITLSISLSTASLVFSQDAGTSKAKSAKPVLQMRSDNNQTLEEAVAKWQQEVENYINKQLIEKPQLAKQGLSSNLTFSLYENSTSQEKPGGPIVIGGPVKSFASRSCDSGDCVLKLYKYPKPHGCQANENCSKNKDTAPKDETPKEPETPYNP